MPKVLLVFGTRPEAVKLCPVVAALRARPKDFEVVVCVTAQHRQMLDQVLTAFGVVPDYDLDLMLAGQTLSQSTARTIAALEGVIRTVRPEVMVVQGDTTTTFCGALAAFYQRVPVAHVEAGLRTGDIFQPYPEEMNRLMTTRLATLHLAATEAAAGNLRREGIAASAIFVTGQSGIDAVRHICRQLELGNLQASEWPVLKPGRKLIVTTAHRRESFGEGIRQICTGLAQLAIRNDVHIVFPVHPNPAVSGPVREMLGASSNVELCHPLDYVPFVDLMRRCSFLITDSGGLQEEAPSLGKPVLVTRDKTERPEAIEAGMSQLVGTDSEALVKAASLLLDGENGFRPADGHNIFGDGRASDRIADAISSF
jgi:UDP-N-acetylglucosamine 2-epimerase (non-hydrolysing)